MIKFRLMILVMVVMLFSVSLVNVGYAQQTVASSIAGDNSLKEKYKDIVTEMRFNALKLPKISTNQTDLSQNYDELLFYISETLNLTNKQDEFLNEEVINEIIHPIELTDSGEEQISKLQSFEYALDENQKKSFDDVKEFIMFYGNYFINNTTNIKNEGITINSPEDADAIVDKVGQKLDED